MMDTEMVVTTKDIDETLAHVSVDATLYRVVDGRYTALNLEEDVEKPFRIGIEMFPMGDEHIIAYGFIASVHSLLESREIFRAAFLDNLTKRLPVLANVVAGILTGIADTPVAGYGEYDVILL